MLELHTKTFEKPIDLAPELCDSFKDPLIFYLKHKDDSRTFFFTFAVLDFKKKSLTYVVSYLPENIALVENHPRRDFFQVRSSIANPHCAILTKKNEEFLVFFEIAPFFFRVNYQKNFLEVYAEDILEKNSHEEILSFSPTNFKDDEDLNHFYFSVITFDKMTKKRNLHLYRAALDLSRIEKIRSQSNAASEAAHVVRKVGHYVISSDFLTRQFKNLKTGEIFKDNLAYMQYVYNSLYEEYCRKNNQTYSKNNFQEKNFVSTDIKMIRLESGFNSYCLSKGKNFLEICKRNNQYSFSPMPGSVMVLDLETREEKSFSTTFCSPAHFEIDEKTGDIFASSHNFSFFGKMHFFGPAAIDRFKLEKGELVKISTFSHSTGYRFTSHRVFSWQNKTYICTLGQPNRLFFIDAETMELEFHVDIEDDLLSQQRSVADFLNHTNLESFVVKTIEVSQDGQFIFLMSYDYLYFYSFPERRIVQKMRYNEGTSPDGEIVLSDFIKKTTHTNYLS